MKLINFRRTFLKKPSCFPPEHIRLINLIDSSKTKDLIGEIYLVHCKDHDCITLIFCFKGFYDNKRLLTKIFYFR